MTHKYKMRLSAAFISAFVISVSQWNPVFSRMINSNVTVCHLRECCIPLLLESFGQIMQALCHPIDSAMILLLPKAITALKSHSTEGSIP